ncbi:MAG: 30S ribosomal protein S27ae [Nanoarchaeota archaeon]|jgi:ribosomal protein S27AE
MGKSKEKAKSSTPSKKYQFYKDGKKTRKECPQCGKGIFLGLYSKPDRYHCGKCSYVEYITNKN